MFLSSTGISLFVATVQRWRSSREEVVMLMPGNIQKHGLWNWFSSSVAAQSITTIVVAAIVILLASKYIW
jgi:hypothetical protein